MNEAPSYAAGQDRELLKAYRDRFPSGGLDLPPRPVNATRASGTPKGTLHTAFDFLSSNQGNGPRSLEEEKKEFHSQNQAFLEQARRDKQQVITATSRSVLLPARPSPVNKSSRKISLASIENDNWEDEKHDVDHPVMETTEVAGNRVELDMRNFLLAAHHLRNASDISSVTSFPTISLDDSSLNSAPPPPPLQSVRLSGGEAQFRDDESVFSPDLEAPVLGQDATARRTELTERLENMLGMQEKPVEKKKLVEDYVNRLERERETLIAKWREEFRDSSKPVSVSKKNICCSHLADFFASTEVFISNLPLTIGAVALAWTSMGNVWFKFMEETSGACTSVHYHSPNCTFPEFPGCFECDTENVYYKLGVNFHYVCSCIGGILCLLFFLKMILAWKVVQDELSNPTTCAPFGVICITMVIVFAGHGWIGESVVLTVALVHTCFAFWFLHMALWRFKMLPDPSWFPCTVGLAYPAMKTWLYFPAVGKILLGLNFTFFLFIFFTSVVRVYLNQKISAPVAWLQVSAPSMTLYAISILAQPSTREETMLELSAEERESFYKIHREYYFHLELVMMFLALVGMIGAVYSLVTRWEKFKTREFSPAHVVFAFPILSHANSLQVFRGVVGSYTSFAAGSGLRVLISGYWVSLILIGTLANSILTYLFAIHLNEWTMIEPINETEPPEPSETVMAEMLDDAREIMRQPFVSPAVLQANEAGTLVRVRRGTADFKLRGPYVRTRKVSSLGFDPTMSDAELRAERAALLDWVARNAPRSRNRTWSIPGMLKLQASDLNRYGTFGQDENQQSHRRAATLY